MSKYTIQDIFRAFAPECAKQYNLSYEQYRVINAITNCKTGSLGTHTITCDDCGKTETGLNSCRNRHCPICQSYAKEKWIQKECLSMLDCNYYHVVTTVPAELNAIFLYNRKDCYNILFKATAESILELAKDPKWLGAKIGITSLLHTWGQTLEYHPHIHSIVTGGGLSSGKWVESKQDYLFKIQVLSSLFRGKFLAMLKKATLVFPKELQNLKNDTSFNKFLEPLYKKDWVTHIEPSRGSPENIIKYIGAYAFRVAISNERILDVTDRIVTFEYKDYKDNAKKKTMSISAVEFIRRFLLHVLPKRFNKIKHYGILANRNKKPIIALCRILIRQLVNRDFTIDIKRVLKKIVCKSCGSDSFSYDFSYKSKYRTA